MYIYDALRIISVLSPVLGTMLLTLHSCRHVDYPLPLRGNMFHVESRELNGIIVTVKFTADKRDGQLCQKLVYGPDETQFAMRAERARDRESFHKFPSTRRAPCISR